MEEEETEVPEESFTSTKEFKVNNNHIQGHSGTRVHALKSVEYMVTPAILWNSEAGEPSEASDTFEPSKTTETSDPSVRLLDCV